MRVAHAVATGRAQQAPPDLGGHFKFAGIGIGCMTGQLALKPKCHLRRRNLEPLSYKSTRSRDPPLGHNTMNCSSHVDLLAGKRRRRAWWELSGPLCLPKLARVRQEDADAGHGLCVLQRSLHLFRMRYPCFHCRMCQSLPCPVQRDQGTTTGIYGILRNEHLPLRTRTYYYVRAPREVQ
jgi:hypothetical protein